MSRPAVKLSALREIGWTVWDPIGLFDMVGPDFSKGPADEYDSYLMVAFGMTQSGKSIDEVADYLTEIASAYMGLSGVDGTTERATAERLSKLAHSLT